MALIGKFRPGKDRLIHVTDVPPKVDDKVAGMFLPLMMQQLCLAGFANSDNIVGYITASTQDPTRRLIVIFAPNEEGGLVVGSVGDTSATKPGKDPFQVKE